MPDITNYLNPDFAQANQQPTILVQQQPQAAPQPQPQPQMPQQAPQQVVQQIPPQPAPQRGFAQPQYFDPSQAVQNAVANPPQSLWTQGLTKDQMLTGKQYLEHIKVLNDATANLIAAKSESHPFAAIAQGLFGIGGGLFGRSGAGIADTFGGVASRAGTNKIAQAQAQVELAKSTLEPMAKFIEGADKAQFESYEKTAQGLKAYGELNKTMQEAYKAAQYAQAYPGNAEALRKVRESTAAVNKQRERLLGIQADMFGDKTQAQIANQQASATLKNAQAGVVAPLANSLINYRGTMAGAASKNANTNAGRAETYATAVKNTGHHLDYLEKHGGDMLDVHRNRELDSAIKSVAEEQTLFNLQSDPEVQKKMAPQLHQHQLRVQQMVKAWGLPQPPPGTTGLNSGQHILPGANVAPGIPGRLNVPPPAVPVPRTQLGPGEVEAANMAQPTQAAPVIPTRIAFQDLIKRAKGGDRAAKAELLIHLNQLEQQSQPASEPQQAQEEE
jgi:hypothetical protein